jgi:hypothetical protein
MIEPEPLADVLMVTGTLTSAGPGPGVLALPASEANALLSRGWRLTVTAALSRCAPSQPSGRSPTSRRARRPLASEGGDGERAHDHPG